jgi:hypothetical protein
MNNDLNENQLNTIYDNFQKEQLKMMNDLKNNNNDDTLKAKHIQKQISLINTININILRFRNNNKIYTEKLKNI